MENYDKVVGNAADKLGYLNIQEDVAGSTANRFGIFLESVEAKANRLTAAWEKLVTNLGNSDSLKALYDVGIGLLEWLNGFIDKSPKVTQEINNWAIAGNALLEVLKLIFVALIANMTVIKSFVLTDIPRVIEAIWTWLSKLPALITLITTATQGAEAAAAKAAIAYNAWAAAIVLWVYAGYQFLELQKLIAENTKKTDDAFESVTKSMIKEGASANDMAKAYLNIAEAIRQTKKDQGLAGLFFDDGAVIAGGFVKIEAAVRKTANTYTEYRDAVDKMVAGSNAHIKENGDVVETVMLASGKSFDKVVGHVIASANAFKNFNTETLGGAKNWGKSIVVAVEEVKDEYASLSTTLGLLNKDIQNITKIEQNAVKGEFSYDDLIKLMEVYPQYIDALTIEGGKVKLNTDITNLYNLSLVDKAIAKATANNATEKEIAILQNYREQIDRSIPKNKEYAHSFQDILNATNELMATQSKPTSASSGNRADIDLTDYGELDLAFAKVGKELTNLNYMNEQGIITSEEYFTQLKTELENIDMTKTFDKNTKAAELFFSGIVTNAAESFQQLNSMFDAGQIGIVSYMDQLSKLMDVFGVINTMMSSYQAKENLDGKDAVRLTQERIKNTEGLTAANQKMKDMQELVAAADQTRGMILEGTIKAGTKEYEEQIRTVADAAVASNQLITDAQGNVLATSDEMFNYMAKSTGNFEVVAQQVAKSIQTVLRSVMANIGNMLISLSKTIKDFNLQININPKQTGEKFDLSAMVLGQDINFLSMKGVTIDFTGSGVNGQSITDMLSNFAGGMGQSALDMSLNLTLDANVLGVLGQFNQVGGAAAKASKEFGGLNTTIKDTKKVLDDAAKAAQDQANAMGDLLKIVMEMIKQQKEAEKESLKTELDDYKQLIDAQKDHIAALRDEANYQDDLKDSQKDLSKIQQELIDLALDDSEEAKAKRLKLKDEEAKKVTEIDKKQRDHQFEEENKALDDDYKKFEKTINAKIKVIDDYLKRTGDIANDAMELINNKATGFYESLLKWNRVYGDGIDATVTKAWDAAYTVLDKFKNLLGKIDYQATMDALLKLINEAKKAAESIDKTIENAGKLADATIATGKEVQDQEENYNLDLNGDGVIGKNRANSISSFGKSNADIAKLVDNGVSSFGVNQASNIMNKVMPSMVDQKVISSANIGGLHLDKMLDITVNGNLDKSVLPDLDTIVNKAIDKLNKALNVQGLNRSAKPFSI